MPDVPASWRGWTDRAGAHGLAVAWCDSTPIDRDSCIFCIADIIGIPPQNGVSLLKIFGAGYEVLREQEAAPMKARIAEIARSMPGYITHKGYVADDGERVSVHYWESEEQLCAFRDHPEHREIQKFGRDKLYKEFSSYVCEVIRDAKFPLEKA